jgi:hypothetical protein
MCNYKVHKWPTLDFILINKKIIKLFPLLSKRVKVWHRSASCLIVSPNSVKQLIFIKFHHITGHECQEGEYMYSSTNV